MTQGRSHDEDEALSGVVGDLAGAASRLIRGEVALAKANLRASLAALAFGLVLVLVALVLGLVALNMLATAAALGLHHLGLGRGWAFLITGGGLILLAGLSVFLALRAIRRARPMDPRQLERLRHDATALKQAALLSKGHAEHD